MPESWESADKSVKKDVLEKGTPPRKPTECAVCTVIIENIDVIGASPDDLRKLFRTEILDPMGEKTISIGDANTEIDWKVERAIEMMLVGERSLVTIRVSVPNDTNETVNIGECVTVKFEATLVKFVPYKPIWEWTPEEKYEVALKRKEVGVRLFKESRYVDAFRKFSGACKILITLEPISDLELGDLEEKINHLRLILYNNLAGCQLSRNNYERVIALCTKILEKDPNNVKALYRRGVAYDNLRDVERATADLKAIVALEPNNHAAKKLLSICNGKLKDANRRSDDMVRRMFKI